MLNLKSNLLAILLFAVILIEGFGFQNSRLVSLYLILSLPLILLLYDIKNHISIHFPKDLTILFSAFFALSALSAIFSKDIFQSFEYLLFYLSAYLIFVYANNRKDSVKGALPGLLVLTSLALCAYSLAINFTPLKNSLGLLPKDGYQMVFSRYGSHNHLGDFLLLPVVIILYNLLKKGSSLNQIAYLILVFPFFLFSFSRSAYLGLALSSGFLFATASKLSLAKKPAVMTALILFTVLLPSLMFLAVVKNSPLVTINKYLSEKFSLNEKIIHAHRLEYTSQALYSIVEKPIFGVGPGNFYLASEKYTKDPQWWTETAHNVFLEIMTENGILAGLIFFAIIIVAFKRSKPEAFSIAAFVLLLNFQTDYTYRIFSLFLLFFVLLGVSYEEKKAFVLKDKVAIAVPLALSTASLLLLIVKV